MVPRRSALSKKGTFRQQQIVDRIARRIEGGEDKWYPDVPRRQRRAHLAYNNNSNQRRQDEYFCGGVFFGVSGKTDFSFYCHATS